MIDFKSRLKGGIIGLCVGDALGVPVEFTSRESLLTSPVTEMTGYGTYKQPPGTWSDDSSMTFCTIESLCKGDNLTGIAENFIKWRDESYWTPYGIVFDIGIGTNKAIIKLKSVKDPRKAGNVEENSNGNGSLMRILPLAFYFKEQDIDKRFEIISDVSSLTHAHIRSVIACFIYTELASLLIKGMDKHTAYNETIIRIKEYLEKMDIEPYEYSKFTRVLDGSIDRLEANMISSSGYVIDSLEVSIWTLLTTSSFSEAVLKSINLGGDTDTNGAITGGLAGIYYGLDSIHPDWIKKTARIDDIIKLIEKFHKAVST